MWQEMLCGRQIRLAGPGEALVSRTVEDLVADSGSMIAASSHSRASRNPACLRRHTLTAPSRVVRVWVDHRPVSECSNVHSTCAYRRRFLDGDFDRSAYRQPAEPLADVLWRTRELAFDVLASLPEVLPPFVVDWNGGARADEVAQLDGVPGGHGVADRSRYRELHAPKVQDRGADRQPVGDVAYSVVENSIPRDPQDTVLLAVPAKREADDVARERVAEGWAVAAGRGRDLDRRPPGCFEPRRLPGLESAGGAAQALCACRRRDDDARCGSSARPAGSRLSS